MYESPSPVILTAALANRYMLSRLVPSDTLEERKFNMAASPHVHTADVTIYANVCACADPLNVESVKTVVR